MAFVSRWVATATIVDRDDFASVVSINVSEADAEAWLTAADGAKAATEIGIYFDALDAMTLGRIRSKSVAQVQDDDAIIDYDGMSEQALRGNRIVFSYQAGLKRYTLSIPARDPASITPASAGDRNRSQLLDDPAQMSAFVAAFEAVAVGDNGVSPVSIVRATLNDN